MEETGWSNSGGMPSAPQPCKPGSRRSHLGRAPAHLAHNCSSSLQCVEHWDAALFGRVGQGRRVRSASIIRHSLANSQALHELDSAPTKLDGHAALAGQPLLGRRKGAPQQLARLALQEAKSLSSLLCQHPSLPAQLASHHTCHTRRALPLQPAAARQACRHSQQHKCTTVNASSPAPPSAPRCPPPAAAPRVSAGPCTAQCPPPRSLQTQVGREMVHSNDV